MRAYVDLKMKDFAGNWLAKKERHLGVMNEQTQSLAENIEDNLMDTIPDFHEYFFTSFESDFSPYNEHTRQYLFLLLYSGLEAWSKQGICSWDTFRVVLTPAGERVLSKPEIPGTVRT